MTDQRQLDRLLGAFFVDGPDELADRVIEAAFDQIDQTRQRRAVRMPWRFATMNMLTRLAAAAMIGVLVVGGAFYLIHRGQPAVLGGPSPTPGLSAGPSESASPSAVPSPTVVRPRAASWSVTGSMVTPRAGHTATLLPDGKVLVAGGDGLVEGVSTASAELYDPSTGAWTATGTMLTPRQDATATLLPDGKVLVAGGGRQATEFTWLASAELYDPGTGAWTATGTMLTPRQGGTATLLRDGKVLVAGGWANGSASASGPVLASAELYDPGSGTWSVTGSMVRPRAGHTATLLPDGKVLVAGGNNPTETVSVLASAELYDPGSGSWTATANMLTTGVGFTATLLLDGEVLVAGGLVSTGGLSSAELTSAELYDPGSGSWTATASMLTLCADHTATLLRDGSVLVAGYGNSGQSICLYDPGSGG
jgi:N-acetylneuraminic acid mutarotase